MNKLLAVLSVAALAGGGAGIAHADPIRLPVCRAILDDPPVADGMYVVSFARIECQQQPDALRTVAMLQFRYDGAKTWSTAHEEDSEVAPATRLTIPLGARCEVGNYRVLVDLYERIAGHTFPRRTYVSPEKHADVWNCMEKGM